MSTSDIQRHGMTEEERLERQLGELAMRFRGTRQQVDRTRIVKEYSHTVEELINQGQWKEMPAPEDQLPDDWMPQKFIDYWSRQ